MGYRRFLGAIAGIAMALALTVLTACEIRNNVSPITGVELPDDFHAHEPGVNYDDYCYYYGPGELVLLAETEGYALWEYRSGLRREPNRLGLDVIPEDRYAGTECARGRRFGRLGEWNELAESVRQQIASAQDNALAEQELQGIRQRLERQADEKRR